MKYMNDKRILIVDDERPIVDILKFNLEKEGFATTVAYDGEQAINVALSVKPDLILLDLMLPKIDGFNVCKEIRKHLTCPIIMLTAKEEVVDKIIGLELGADDYMTKPFGVNELQARISALLRRIKKDEKAVQPQNEDTIVSGPFSLNMRSRILSKNGEVIDLTSVEFSIMELFFKNEGMALTREKILEGVWGQNYYGDIKIVDVNIRRLRMKIEEDPSSPEFIVTVWGYGYRWTV